MKNNRIIICVIIAIISTAIIACGKKEKTEVQETIAQTVNETILESEESSFSPEYVDVEEYYSEHATVQEQITADQSESIQSEKQISDEFISRGFEDETIYTSYSMKGDYSAEAEITDDDVYHPVYYVYYQTADGEFWTLTSINGCMMAYPVNYNMENESGAELMVTETDYCISYDSVTNQFFKTIPDEETLRIIKVDHIDKNTLDSITLE